MTTITPELRQAIAAAGNRPLRLEDPDTRQVYVLIAEDRFERIQAGLEPDAGPLTIDEQRRLLAHTGQRAGWDDPALDAYNRLDPRQ
jgi:hypothetical protein